jgi:hypothetical protein
MDDRSLVDACARVWRNSNGATHMAVYGNRRRINLRVEVNTAPCSSFSGNRY